MGAWTGKDKKDCATAEVNAARESDAWEWKPPGLSHDEQLEGESYRDVEERFLAFLEDQVLSTPALSTEADPKGKEPVVAIFSHHAAIRCALRPIVEASPRMLSPKLNLKNTSITEISYDAKTKGRKGGWSLVRVNDHAHLEGLGC